MASTLATAVDHSDNKLHLLLAASGSVATIKIPNIITALARHKNLSIRLVFSDSAVNFLAGQSHEQPSLEQIFALPNVDGIYLDKDEWSKPWVRADKILHIELRRWAHVLVIAPLSANSLAKMALGMSDNLLLSTVRAWDTTGLIDAARSPPPSESMTEALDGKTTDQPSRKLIVVAPAMNTAMWHHPVTAQHMRVLEQDWGVDSGGWIKVLRPIEKELACGDVGSGAMREWTEIVKVIETHLGL